ncbi:cation:proton antiporter [Streptomyces sp. NPDC015139]|uniref:cation:proton antiporter n=1 Tax=Streptomyces sp. NPDC015139 TaxID=3364942 RepID=UPI0036FDB50D
MLLDTTGHFFLGAAAVLALSHLAGVLAVRLGQPRVMGEIAAGITLGPSVLGALSPQTGAWLFPPAILPMLNGLAQIGLALFMFGTGQELASTRVRGATRQSLTISHASLLLPFAAGALVALPLTGDYAPAGTSPLAFVLFVGCAVSITAFPVLARMLEDLGISRTRPGRLSLFASAVGDGGSWLALSAVLALAHGSGPMDAVAGALIPVAVIAVCLGPVRRLVTAWFDRRADRTNPTTLTVALVVAIGVSAATTAALGLHQLIGALLVGLIWPAGNRRAAAAAAPLTATAKTVLLPFFFMGYGLGVDLGALRLSAGAGLVPAALLAAAVVTKIGGTGLGARYAGLPWTESLAVGILMNTRGLTELVVLQIGHEAHIIDDRMFALLTVVALMTTLMTAPLLKLTRTLPPPEPTNPIPTAPGEPRVRA